MFDKGLRDLVCACLAQAVGDALFLRRVGSLDDNLQVTGKLPIVYRASQWPVDLRDVEEVARFFNDGRLQALINLVGLDYSPYAFKKAAMTLPVDHPIRNDWRSETKRVFRQKSDLPTMKEKQNLKVKQDQWNAGNWNKSHYKHESTKKQWKQRTENSGPTGDTSCDPLLND